MLGYAVLGVALAACQPTSDRPGLGTVDLPTGEGPLPRDAVTWAVADTIHVGDRTIRAEQRVRAMVAANGRIYFLQGHSDVVRVTDGGPPQPTGVRADELSLSSDGRYLGYLDTSEGLPWSTVVVDLDSGQVVVHDGTGMGDADDDLPDLYEDAEPRVLGFEGDELFVEVARGDAGVLSWDARTGTRTEHDEELFYFADPDPGGGRELPALVRHGRLVLPRDPYRSTHPGHLSPDGSIGLLPVGDRTEVFSVDTGRRLPVDLRGRWFLLGGWTGDDTAYGVAFDRRPYGPHRVRLVVCRLTVEQRRCRVVRTVQPPAHDLVLFPTGSAATDY